MPISEDARTSLKETQIQSTLKTRRRIEEAIIRLQSNFNKNEKLSVSAVAKESGIDRSTIYRFHREVLIQMSSTKADSVLSKENASKPIEAPKKLETYRNLTIQAQSDVVALARVNYQLDSKIKELEAALKVRDDIINSLKMEINCLPKPRNVHNLR